MTGVLENKTKQCPTCGGSLENGTATIPFVTSANIIIVVKNVPAEICLDCREPFVKGKVTDQMVLLLNQLKSLKSEVSVVTYSQQHYNVA
jgi:YgiT-type zinc finger domain-containing protein